MSLLFDQNISFRICKLIQNSFPNAKQVRELSLELKKEIILDFISNPIYNEISCLEIN